MNVYARTVHLRASQKKAVNYKKTKMGMKLANKSKKIIINKALQNHSGR